MDYQMPEMDGPEVTRRWRAEERETNREPVPVIAVTANVYRQDRDTCNSAGMNDFLGKPVSPASIQAMVRKWLPVSLWPDAAARDMDQQGACRADGVLDENLLAGLMTAMGEGFSEVVALFRDEIPPLLEALRAAVTTADRAGVREIAHRLKGSAAGVSAVRMAQSCRVLEGQARDLDINLTASVVTPVEVAYRQALAALEGVLLGKAG
jgi:two-component system sensor histidine kinase/response regulator